MTVENVAVYYDYKQRVKQIKNKPF